MRFSIALISIFLTSANPGSAPTSELRSQQRSNPETSSSPELAKVRELIEKAKFDAAENEERQYIARHPQSPDDHFWLGIICFRQVQPQARSTGTYLAQAELPRHPIEPAALEAKVRAELAGCTAA